MDSQSSSIVAVMLRYPEVGKTKTRLIPKLGSVGATYFYRKLAEHCIKQVCDSSAYCMAHVAPGEKLADAQEWLGRDADYSAQFEGDLGERLIEAMSAGFNKGATKVIAIGTDCPALNSTLLDHAFEALDSADVVIGPADDGGYYLIGTKEPRNELFTNIPWSSSNTLKETMAACDRLALSVSKLETLSDIDLAGDIDLHYPDWKACAQKATSLKTEAEIWL